MSTESRVDGIPFRRGNSMSTEFRGHPGVHNVEKPLKSVFTIGCFRNSADTEFVCFSQFRIFRILYGIAQNSEELCGIPYRGIRRIPRNFAEFRNF